jgi:thymidylate synthase
VARRRHNRIAITDPIRSQYEDFLRHVSEHGRRPRPTAPAPARAACSGNQMRFDLSEGFPLVTTKKVHLKSILYELLWFLRGDGNARWLQERGVTIWDEWARPTATSARSTACNGVRGRHPTAGTSTRSPIWSSSCRTNPDSRRLIVSAWNVAELPKMALAALPRVLPVLRRRRASCPASSTSAAPTSSSACRSTSPATRC